MINGFGGLLGTAQSKKGVKTIMKGKILFPFRRVAHVNDVQEAPKSRLEKGFSIS
jgi:hypothetical protein